MATRLTEKLLIRVTPEQKARAEAWGAVLGGRDDHGVKNASSVLRILLAGATEKQFRRWARTIALRDAGRLFAK